MKQKINCSATISDIPKECNNSFNSQQRIKYNPKTKEVFDELDNFLGYGEYDEFNKIITIK